MEPIHRRRHHHCSYKNGILSGHVLEIIWLFLEAKFVESVYIGFLKTALPECLYRLYMRQELLLLSRKSRLKPAFPECLYMLAVQATRTVVVE
jgi:hypothetical protein